MKTIFQHRRVIQALDFAIRAHDGQHRKDNETLYITHPIGVAALVSEYGGNVDQVIAAILHDTVEDCETTIDDVERVFGSVVSTMVDDLTNISKQDRPELNRAARKELDAQRLATVSLESQLVKLCDIYYNISDLVGLEPGFRIKFLKEKKLQTQIMTKDWSRDIPSGMRAIRVAILDKIDDLIK